MYLLRAYRFVCGQPLSEFVRRLCCRSRCDLLAKHVRMLRVWSAVGALRCRCFLSLMGILEGDLLWVPGRHGGSHPAWSMRRTRRCGVCLAFKGSYNFP